MGALISHKNERGSVIYMALGATLLIALLGVVTVRTMGRHSRATGTDDEIQEVEMIRRVLLDALDCRQTVQPPLDGAAKCGNAQYILKDRQGNPLYPQNSNGGQTLVWKNPAGSTLPTWELRTTCKGDALYVERRQFRIDGSRSLLSGFLSLWPSGIDPKLCSSYFQKQWECAGKYNIAAGGGKDSPNCCRVVDAGGNGGAAAVCDATEYLHLGGAWCGSKGGSTKSSLLGARKDVSRCVLDVQALAIKHIGQGSARGVTITSPSLPAMHTDPALPAIMDARMTFPRTKSMLKDKDHGGFLLQSGYGSSGNSATIDSWVASCKFDDWQGAFSTVARAYCCPKKPKGYE